jgi:PKD repeat protein
VVTYTGCASGGSSITGMAFYQGGSYPAKYDGALFFADHTRDEIWAMLPGSNGLPDPSRVESFVGVDSTGAAAGHPVDLKIGPGGDLFYVDMDDGTLHRITYTDTNQPPVASLVATPTNGTAPLPVELDAGGSTDPEGGALTYDWDLDGDGTYGDATGPSASYTYPVGTFHPSVRVTDADGASDTASTTITAGNTPPHVVIDSPIARTTWQVGETIPFAGEATDAQDGALPPSAMSWRLVLHHCYSQTNCHTHLIQTFDGVSSGSLTAPDHEYPCWLELQVTATDSGGLSSTTSVRLDPKTVDLTFKTGRGGPLFGKLVVNDAQRSTPFTVTAVVGSANSATAPSPETFAKSSYSFVSWSDGGPRTQTITAPATDTTYTATYKPIHRQRPCGPTRLRGSDGLFCRLNLQVQSAVPAAHAGARLGAGW